MKRVLGELLTLAAAGAGAFWVWGLPVVGVVLVVAGTAVVLLLARTFPATDAPLWPRLPAVERAGRRAEVFRLSWNLSAPDGVGTEAAWRLREIIATRRVTAPAAERTVLDALTDRLSGLDITLRDVDDVLRTLEEDRTST